MNRLKEILLLKNLKGLGKVTIYKKYSQLISSSSGFDDFVLNLRMLRTYSELEIDNAIKRVDEIITMLQNNHNIAAITYLDSNYPQRFNVMKDKRPLVLYIAGNIEVIDKPNIAVVGSRDIAELSVVKEEQIVREIIEESGRVIVSGLALGCDKVAHEATLNCGGITMAIMPCGLNHIAPASNKGLAQSIVDNGGCLLSEYEPDMRPTKNMFVERDALVAAFSDATFVVECGVNSGTMHTVKYAVEYDRRLACLGIKGIRAGHYEGNEYIIHNMNAERIEEISDLKLFLSGVDKENNTSKNEFYEQLSICDLFGNNE